MGLASRRVCATPTEVLHVDGSGEWTASHAGDLFPQSLPTHGFCHISERLWPVASTLRPDEAIAARLGRATPCQAEGRRDLRGHDRGRTMALPARRLARRTACVRNSRSAKEPAAARWTQPADYTNVASSDGADFRPKSARQHGSVSKPSAATVAGLSASLTHAHPPRPQQRCALQNLLSAFAPFASFVVNEETSPVLDSAGRRRQ